MEMIERKVFPTLIGQFEEVLFKEQCEELISSIDSSPMKRYGALTGDSKTSFTTYVNILNSLPENLSFIIKMKIDTCIDQYIRATNFNTCSVDNVWMSYQYPHSKLVKHSHPGSHISGVLYLKADEKSSPIYFYNPNPFISFTTISDKSNEYGCDYLKFKPNTGTMLIFPSWLSHGSGEDENMSEERIILSFNAKENAVAN